jgi:hypothetical protein
MARPTHDRPALDPDQAAALHRLRAAFGAEQVTVIDLQPTSQDDQDSGPTQAPAWQPTLVEEAS